MKCSQARQYLYELLTGRVTDDVRREIEAHLKGCPACREELEKMRVTVGLLDHAATPRLSRDFTHTLMNRIERDSCPFYRKPVWRRVMQGTAAAVVVLAAVAVLRMMPGEQQAPLSDTPGQEVVPESPRLRGTVEEDSGADGCAEAARIYNQSIEATDQAKKEALLKRALERPCSDNRVLANIRNNLGDCYERRGYTTMAIAEYERAIELDATLPYPCVGLGDIYRQRGETGRAGSWYRRALGLLDNATLSDRVQARLDALESENGTRQYE